jgi:hypothetical protein
MKQSSCITALMANMRRQVYATAKQSTMGNKLFDSSCVLLWAQKAVQISYHKIYTLNIKNNFRILYYVVMAFPKVCMATTMIALTEEIKKTKVEWLLVACHLDHDS